MIYINLTIISGLLLSTVFFALQNFTLRNRQEKVMIELAHKLQTPLTILKGQLDLAQQNNELKNLDQTINNTSGKINQILNAINQPVS